MSCEFFNECICSSIKRLFRMRKYLEKPDLIQMIVYGWCITEKLNKKEIEDISTTQANLILNKSNVTVKSLPGYGNASIKRKEIKPYVNKETPLIKIWLIYIFLKISSYIK